MVIIVVVPDPEYVVPPGDSVTVHVPAEGRFVNSILPLGLEQSGWVTEPVIGVPGVEPDALITPVAEEATEVQPETLSVTVNVYEDPGAKPVNVVVVPEPEAEPEGVPVMVHEPAGNPLRSTEPVGVVQSG